MTHVDQSFRMMARRSVVWELQHLFPFTTMVTYIKSHYSIHVSTHTREPTELICLVICTVNNQFFVVSDSFTLCPRRFHQLLPQAEHNLFPTSNN